MVSANLISVRPVEGGWAVMLTDGRELARFTGADAKRKALGYAATPDARRKALRYVASTNPVRRHPSLDRVRSVLREGGQARHGA
jgi:hypothetical protein